MKNLLSHPLFLSLSLLPLFLSIFLFEMRFQNLSSLNDTIEEERSMGSLLKEKSKQQKKLLSNIQTSRPNYLTTALQKFQPLAGERRRLSAMSGQKKASYLLAERLEFLRSEKNKLCFLEEKRERGEKFQEVFLKLKNPVEIDEEDLKHLLLLIETTDQEKPQLLIEDLQIQKKKTISEEEVFLVNLNLIQREAL